MSSSHHRNKAILTVLAACVLVCDCNAHAFERNGKSPVGQTLAVESGRTHVPDWVVFPGDKWDRITPEQAGLDVEKFNELLKKTNVHPGGWGGTAPTDKQWGAVLTRGGYIVHTWGDPKYKTQSASLGKCITRALFVPKELIVGPVDLKRRQVSQPTHEVKVDRNVRVPMRDGVSLAAEIYRPDAEGKFPALMLLRYYQIGKGQADYFARRGYVCVLVDCRGRGGSEGQWDPYVNDPQDGYDAQQWIGTQNWCNGKIGMFGRSYNAFTQTMSATMASPYLKCLLPLGGQQTNFGHLYNDGVPQLNVIFTFGLYATGSTRTGPHIPIGPHYLQLPLMAAADKADNSQAQRIKTWLKHSSYDDYWKSYGLKQKYDKVQAPAYFGTGWYDNLVHEAFRNFKGFRQQGGSEACREGTRIHVSGGVHGSYDVSDAMHLRWYDYWLKGIDTGIRNEPPIEIFVMGMDKYRFENEWPLARTEWTKFYLQSGGKANSLDGDGRLSTLQPAGDSPSDGFVYDPADPVYTLGGQMSTHRDIWGPKDRSERQTRRDVLVYTTEPLAADTEVTGPVELKLYAASSAVDTDFTATLTDVHPDGRAIHICEGIRRASFRKSLENPTPIEPGEIYEYTISLWETSMVFMAGHRIRLEISSSNFPRYARNLNTGLPLGASDEMKKATQTVFHDARHASHLILPIIPQAKPKPILPSADSTLTLPAARAATDWARANDAVTFFDVAWQRSPGFRWLNTESTTRPVITSRLTTSHGPVRSRAYTRLMAADRLNRRSPYSSERKSTTVCR